MSNLQGDGSSKPSAVKREENTPAAEQGGERRLDTTENGQEIEIEEGGGELVQDEDPTPPVQDPPNAASAKKVFGTMKRSNPTVRKGNDPYNYEEKYPEDPIYEETAPNARVWRTYEDESRNHDANMVEESRDNVDVLLVFAGLFSAVVTTFVAQTSQSLQPDYAAMSASLLYESVLVQRAIANGSPVDAIVPSSLNPTIAFVPATTDVWVNGLWFTSLFLSLTTALVAVLVKQWLHHYVALPSGTPRDRSFTRQFRYAGFQKWHVQVIVGLLPVLMHLALAIFLSGLVIFLHPLRAALSWIICAGTTLVYAAYAVATILPILFPQCPYRTPLCDLVYVTFCRIVPQVTWDDKARFFSACRAGSFSDMLDYLPHVQARNLLSLTMIESESVEQMSTNLAAEALDWLFAVSSNRTVQSIVVQSIGGLPMASAEKFQVCQGDNGVVYALEWSLLRQCLQAIGDDIYEPVPGMELKFERLLRFHSHFYRIHRSHIVVPNTSYELTAAILSHGHDLSKGNGDKVDRQAFLKETIAHALKLPPRCWLNLMKSADVFEPLSLVHDDYTDMFPLYLCSVIFDSYNASKKALTQDFNSPLAVEFKDAFPYFLDKIYDDVLRIFSGFVKDPPSSESSLSQSLRVFVAAIKFLLHRLSLPESDTSHIYDSLSDAVRWISGQTFSSQEATAVITVLEDILVCVIWRQLSDDNILWYDTLCKDIIRAYHSPANISPSACSLRGLRSIVDFMTIQWDCITSVGRQSDCGCRVLTSLLAGRIPVAFTVFLESQCLPFLGNHIFHEASVPMVREYVAGISAMKHGSVGAVKEATFQLHMNHLHNPRNLFTACSILATHGFEDIDRASVYRDITTLVQLRSQDAAWDECRRKLRDLVQSDEGDFFSSQRVWRPMLSDFGPLWTDEIQVEKENIRYAIHVLDDFFDRRARIMGLPELSPARCIGHFLGKCLGRKRDGKPEQEQQV